MCRGSCVKLQLNECELTVSETGPAQTVLKFQQRLNPSILEHVKQPDVEDDHLLLGTNSSSHVDQIQNAKYFCI